MADFDRATRVTPVIRVPIEHLRSLAHVTLIGIDKQGESSIDFDRATRVTPVIRVPIEHPRSLAHVTLLDIDKQGESSRPLPEAIGVWTGFIRVTYVISSDSQ